MNTIDLTWRTSSYSGSNGGECVQVAFHEGRVLIADSKYLRNPANEPSAQPVIEIRAEDWRAFLNAATGVEAETSSSLPAIEHHQSGHISIISNDGTTLTYTPPEWVAFTCGIYAGEFAPA